MTNDSIREDRILDVSGLNCPLPVLKSKAMLATMASEEILKVIATHPDSVKEFASLCRSPQFDLLDSVQEDERFVYWVRKVA